MKVRPDLVTGDLVGSETCGSGKERQGDRVPRRGQWRVDKTHPKDSGTSDGPRLGCYGMTGTDLRFGSGGGTPVPGSARGALLRFADI